MVTHVVFGNAGAGHLRQFIANSKDLEGEIIVLLDDLSVGPLHYVNAKKRIQWWESILHDNEHISAKESATCFDDSRKIKILKKVKTPIIIWLTSISCDEIGFLKLANSLLNFKNDVFLIHVPENALGNIGRPRSLGELGVEKMGKILQYKKKISHAEIDRLSKIWSLISKDESFFRIRKSKFKFTSKPETYFDNEILKLCDDTYQSSAKIGGLIYGSCGFYIDYEYLVWRIRELIKKQKLEFLGDISMMGKFKIKRTKRKVK